MNSISDLREDIQEERKLIGELSHRYDTFIQKPVRIEDRAPAIHASELSGCPRKVVYSLMNTPRIDRSKAPWRKRFKVGHAIHSMLQTDFQKMAPGCDDLTFESEIHIHAGNNRTAETWGIDSHADGLFTFWNSGEPILRVLLEAKSKSPDEFKGLKEPEEEHIEQAHVYMACLDVPIVWFLYWNKGNQNYTGSNLQPFVMTFQESIWRKLERRMMDAHEHLAKQALPPREEGIACQFCSFSHTCEPLFLQVKPKADRRGVVR